MRSLARVGTILAALLGALTGCSEKKSPEPLAQMAPAPLPRLIPSIDAGSEQEAQAALHQVKAAPLFGEPIDPSWRRLSVDSSGAVQLEHERFEKGFEPARLSSKFSGSPLLLWPGEETYVAQVAFLLALLDDAKATVYLALPEAKVAFALSLRDEAAFQAYLDEQAPGRLRVIQRTDGLELVTSIGKVLGVDPNGPSVPNRGGQLDLATAREGLERLAARFKGVDEVCFVPSFGTELVQLAKALSANYRAAGERIFDRPCVVYPRPKAQ